MVAEDASSHLSISRLQRAAALLGLTVSDSQAQAIVDYVNLLVRWNRTYNLTAIRDLDSIWPQHIFDCMAIIGPLQTALRDHKAITTSINALAAPAAAATPTEGERNSSNPPGDGATLWDYGSGAGLPGLILAILMPELRIETYDAVAKKIAFQQQVIGALGLKNVTARHQRVEMLHPATPPHIIVCRAFTSLAEFASRAAPACGMHTLLAAMKSKSVTAELAELPPGWVVHQQCHLRVPELDADRQLVFLRKTPI